MEKASAWLSRYEDCCVFGCVNDGLHVIDIYSVDFRQREIYLAKMLC